MKQKKAQLAFFIVIAILLAIIIGFLVYLNNLEKEGSLVQIKAAKEVPFQIAPVKDFVQNCLTNTALDALETLGKQGGYVYISQGGTFIDFSETDKGLFFVDYNNAKVPFIISKPKFDLQPYYFVNAPNYPWELFPFTDNSFSQQTFNGYFGVNNLLPLTKEHGPHSIQSQIESYIKNNIKDCTKFSVFEEQGFKITAGEVNASVIIALKDIVINLNYPIEIISPQGQKTKIESFTTNFDIRLKELYDFAIELVNKEVSNIEFNIDNPSNDINNFEVRVIRGLGDSNLGYNDVVIIEDLKSLIKGKPFEFSIARQNRMPALKFIDSSLSYSVGETLEKTNIINPALVSDYVIDPDEDIFTINSFSLNPELPYTFSNSDINQNFRLKVSVKDDEGLEDYQILNIRVSR